MPEKTTPVSGVTGGTAELLNYINNRVFVTIDPNILY
jgi:hypothetical protein